MADEQFEEMAVGELLGSGGAGSKRYPPGLAQPFHFGFNAKHWRFARGGPMFEPSFDEKNMFYYPTDLGDFAYDVPDGVFVAECGKMISGEVHLSSNLLRTQDREFATTVETSLGNVSGSATASYALEERSHVSAGSNKATVSTGTLKSIYSFNRNEVGARTARFLADVAALPRAFDADDPESRKKFDKFFEDWGTHYLEWGVFGGTYTLVMTSDEETLKRSNATKTGASLSVSFDAGVASGSAKSTVEQRTADALNVDRKSLQADWYANGGDEGRELDPWMQSINKAEQLLCDVTTMRAAAKDPDVAPLFRPVSALVEAGLAAKIDQALKVYLGVAPTLLPVGDQTRPDWGRVNHAEDSGFLFAAAVPAGDMPANFSGYGVAVDRALDPHTIQAGETMACYSWDTSLFLPIPQGVHFSGQRTDPDGKGGLDVRFQPYPVTFGEWADFPIGETVQAQEPGFLCGHVGMQRPENRGELRAAVDQAEVGASAHAYPRSHGRVAQAGFCVPVRRQATVRTSRKDTAGQCDHKLRFLPIKGGLEFDGPLQPMTVGRAYSAGSDGFVVARLDLARPDLFSNWYWLVGTIRVDDPERPGTSFQTPFSASWETLVDPVIGGDCWLAVATGTAFVRSGSNWQVGVEGTMGMTPVREPVGDAHARCWWQAVRTA